MKILLNKNETYEIKKEEIPLKDFILIAENLKKYLPSSSKLKQSVFKNLGLSCPKCKSFNITKRGFRYNHFIPVQKYYCADCKYKFSLNPGFLKRMRTPNMIINYAHQRRKEGLSYEKIQKLIEKKFKIKLARQSVYRWFKRGNLKQ